MSTRANIVIQENDDQYIWFYRHSDGYPRHTVPSLKKFLQWVIDKRIRQDIVQASGWLVLLGWKEYDTNVEPGSSCSLREWKVGAYEPTTGCHLDVEYVYVIDLVKKELRCYKPNEISDEDGFGHSDFDPKNPPEPFYVVTEENIDEEITEKNLLSHSL